MNDLEPIKKRFLVNFSQFLDAAHISPLNCDEMAGDRPFSHFQIPVLIVAYAVRKTFTPSALQ